MKETILKSLKKIEDENRVKILYACESGSRAWGFPSKNSDYDVRFIYIHKKEDYLSIDPIGIGKKRDVIELPINDSLDVSGWELTKALRLFRKSNPPLLEWLQSGIIYYQAYSAVEKMKEMNNVIFSPQSCLHHYLNMAERNFREFLLGDRIKIKKYFYVLRPVLACTWIEKYNEFPPIEFPILVEALIPEGELKEEIVSLLNRKLAGDELDLESPYQRINQFLSKEIVRLQEFTNQLSTSSQNMTSKLDMLFRETLEEVWT